MSFCQLHWYSDILNKQTETRIILPDNQDGPFTTFYLLHGLSDDCSMWMRQSLIERYVAGKPLIVVMPDGGRGFYTDHDNGPRWGTHIGVELPDFIEKKFPSKKDRAGRVIGGLSMGGYGALRTALAYPDRFCSVTSHSGAVMCPTDRLSVLTPQEKHLMFGPTPEGSQHHLPNLAKQAKALGLLPKISIDCGTEDFLLQQNRDFHELLNQMQIDHEYQEYPGNHNWEYWDLHVREAIDFHLKT